LVDEDFVEEINLYYKKLNIGRTLTCLLHSFKTETACILTEPSPPFKFDEYISGYDFSFLGIESPNPQQVWDRLCFLLSMSGLLLYPNIISTARQKENIVEIITNNNQKIVVRADKIVKFDESETGWYYAYDYFDWRSGSRHGFSELEDTDDNFVKKVIFYSSEREKVSNSVKDIVAVSFLNERELMEVETSSVYSRLKVLRMMRDSGIKGRTTGYNSKGIASFTSPIIEFNKRVTKPYFKPDISFNDVYNLKTKKGYTWKLLEKIIQTTST
jgi:hypothetical protein